MWRFNVCSKAAGPPRKVYQAIGAGTSRGRRIRHLVWGTAAAVVLLAGCGGGKIPKTNYYMLDLSAPQVKPPETLPYTAVMMKLRSSRMLAQDRIVYRETREELGFYEYHRWAEDPRTAIQAALLNQLRARGTFQRVVPFDGRTKADYMIRGRLERLEEVDFDNGVSVHVKLSVELIDTKTSRPVWNGTGEGKGEVVAGEVRNVVAAMSAATRTSIASLASDLDGYLRSSEPPPVSASSTLPRAARE